MIIYNKFESKYVIRFPDKDYAYSIAKKQAFVIAEKELVKKIITYLAKRDCLKHCDFEVIE